MIGRIIKLPPRFIEDSIECGCDVGGYVSGKLVASNEQLAELRDRAKHYAEGGVDQPPAGLIVAARALVRALDKAGAPA